MPDGTAVIRVEGLVKRYNSVVAVDGISFTVRRGEIFGMVGPNGAGKTTTIECIEGLRAPTEGLVEVLGGDPHRNGRAIKARIGVQLQQSSIPDQMKVWEALDLFASFYPRHVDGRALLKRLGLQEKWHAPFGELSGGQQQRLFIALALINDPEIVFLDELTTGLDPQARRSMWELVEDIRRRGKTVFLTTHFMEEAERLCDRVAIIDRGKIIALDSPESLVRRLNFSSRVSFVPAQPLEKERLLRLPSVERVEVSGAKLVAFGRSDRLVVDVVIFLSEQKIPFRDLRMETANLEDVFLTLTGKEIRD